MLGCSEPVDSHSSPVAFRLPASLDRSVGATTFTFSSTAPVACTATVDIGLWLVESLNGTMVTSESKCPLVSTVVVLATADAGRFVPAPPVVATTAATTPPTKTTPRGRG